MKKNCVEEVPEQLSWSHFFSFEKAFFKVSMQSFYHRFMISLALKISHCLSGNHNPELRCAVICTCVTLLNWCYTWTVLLSANQNQVIFSFIQLNSSYITRENITWLKIIQADEEFSVLYQISVHLSIYFSISQRRQRKWTASLIGTVFLGMYQSLHLALIPLHDTNQLLHQILPRVMYLRGDLKSRHR